MEAVVITPIDGWGFLESIDGELAEPFEACEIESGVDFEGIKGWRGKVLPKKHKYAGMNLQMTPRHVEETPVVVLWVFDGEKTVFSGMAETTGLKRDWK
ncbi:MAG: hypothetical protein CVT78_02680 [Alphaproteobacteria bacterium HGW-Alphaproteobacteria-17]|nr:MAG: hypothetical protein CVT78_02680 [Alphaproteobacteria bacterium HGW-Alphaproteobacteria-17]